MSKKYQNRSRSSRKRDRNRQQHARRSAARREVQERIGQWPSSHEGFLALAQESLHSFALDLGVMFAGRLLEDEVTVLCGPRYERNRERHATRYGHQPGVVSLAGQKVSILRPRVRSVSSGGTRSEVELPLYRAIQRPESMPEACLKRMVRRVSCRDYEGVVDLAQQGFGVKKSSVSRGFVRASADAVRALAERRWEGVRFVAAFIDGIEYAGETLVVALGLDAEGHKHILGVREGATENALVVTALLEETVTVVRLTLPEKLRRTLATTNPIESALSVVRDLTARVKRWRDGDMRVRWCAAGLLRAEEKFRRIKGYTELPQLVAALDASFLDAKPGAG